MFTSHEITLQLPLPEERLLQCIGEAARALADSKGWKIKSQTEVSATLRVRINLRSWGEKVTMQAKNGSIVIRSECIFQLVDWGKNRANTDIASKVITECLAARA